MLSATCSTPLTIVGPPEPPVVITGLPFFVTIIGVIDESGRLPARDLVGQLAFEVVRVRHARRDREIVHLIVEDDPERRHPDLRPEHGVDSGGQRDHVAILVRDQQVRGAMIVRGGGRRRRRLRMQRALAQFQD